MISVDNETGDVAINIYFSSIDMWLLPVDGGFTD